MPVEAGDAWAAGDTVATALGVTAEVDGVDVGADCGLGCDGAVAGVFAGADDDGVQPAAASSKKLPPAPRSARRETRDLLIE